MRKLILFYFYLIMVLGLLMLSGCSTTKTPEVVYVPTPIKCEAAKSLPEQPSDSLTLDASRPGEAVKAYASNRAEWIGYGKALRNKLEACQ